MRETGINFDGTAGFQGMLIDHLHNEHFPCKGQIQYSEVDLPYIP